MEGEPKSKLDSKQTYLIVESLICANRPYHLWDANGKSNICHCSCHWLDKTVCFRHGCRVDTGVTGGLGTSLALYCSFKGDRVDVMNEGSEKMQPHGPRAANSYDYASLLHTKEKGVVVVSRGKCADMLALHEIVKCQRVPHGTYQCFVSDCRRPCSVIVRKMGTVVSVGSGIARCMFAAAWPSCGLRSHNKAIDAVVEAQQGYVNLTDRAIDQCYWCRKSIASSSQKWCGRCLSACYCSKECQRSHWSDGHRQQCVQKGAVPWAGTT